MYRSPPHGPLEILFPTQFCTAIFSSQTLHCEQDVLPLRGILLSREHKFDQVLLEGKITFGALKL